MHTKFGFDPDNILVAEIDLSPGSYENRDVLANFYDPLLQRVKAIPGVRAAGLIQIVPIQNWGWNGEVHIAGQPPNPPHEERLAEFRLITPGFYKVENWLLGTFATLAVLLALVGLYGLISY
jgi:putative ABC transport system permease protein